MKSFHSVLVLVICLAMAGNAPAEARPGQHSGTSSSYKSGFSSQKNNPGRGKSAPPPASRQSGPGAFGKAPGSPASAQPQRNTSAMSRDVDQSAARDNALRTLEARRAAANAPPPLPPLNDTLRRPQPAPGYQTPPPVFQPPVQQSSGNGLMHGLLGFMLGRAMSQSNQPVAYPSTGNGQPPAAQPANGSVAGGAVAGAGMIGGMPGLGAPAAAPVPVPPQQQSFGASVLRWFIWLSVLSVIVWTVVYSVRKLRRLRAGNTPNYSFERN
ncbi:hypothetical protein ACEN9F_18660 [Duganella sp. CT11-25]|uniref:hypothetical protein n=1 Tax=unclassified Duganella TaxID=2636909 RepID=UPI0039B02E45